LTIPFHSIGQLVMVMDGESANELLELETPMSICPYLSPMSKNRE